MPTSVTADDEVAIEYWDGRSEHFPTQLGQTSSMDRAVDGIVEWLDKGTPFPYPAAEAAAVLEAIAAFHISNDRGEALMGRGVVFAMQPSYSAQDLDDFVQTLNKVARHYLCEK